MERRNRRNSHGSSLHETMEERSLLRECALVRSRRDEEMEAPISASQGAMRSLPGKLKSLLEPPGHGLTKGEKNKIHLLKGDLEELIANYLMEPAEVHAPALTANCWVKEVRELSYDIDDFFKELIHVDAADAIIDAVQKTPRVMITRLRENLNRRRWIADEISGFRNRVKEAIKLHRNYNLGSCSFRSWRTSDEHPLPPLYARLVHMDKLWDKLHGWLTDEGEQQQRVACIVGIGGVGKTTLAKQVYDKLGGRFECRAFVRTSRKADMRRLLTSMLSQLRRHEPPEADAAWEVHNLIDKIRARLKHKKYFIIIDDLWATSTWDIVSCALPDNPCSRILLTTEFDIVAQMCCGYNSKYIFKMEPLSEDESRELFFSRAFGHQHDCPEQLNEVSYDIIQKCGGLPLATIIVASLLASQPNRIDQWRYIQNSLSSNLRADPTLEGMQQVLNFSYNNLPHRLKACMLYLCMYRESHIIWKNDLVKQWTAEDFISVVEGEDMEEIAGRYIDELVERGMIQPVDINYNGEVLSCAVHYIVLNFIRYKSIEENFVTAIDHSQTNLRLMNKVRRLSLHFGDAEDVTPPSLRLSQVRSVGFFGLFKCMPSILEFNLLQVLILQLWGDDYESYNFTEISKLFLLRYLRINAFHLSVRLPTQMQRLKDLVTLEIERRVTAVPSDIVDLPRLLHLSLPSETALPNGIGRMTSLRTLGYFNLSSSSKDNVLNLGELTNLCDLRLTCSTVPSVNLEDNMQCLSTILWKLRRLKSLTLAPEFSHTKTPDASVSRMSISCDGLGSVSSPPTLLQRLELLPRICIFSSLPKWIRKLDRLSILRIAVRGLSMNDIDILKGLLALTALSLYVRTAPVEWIVFDKAGFPILKYLKFMCTTPCLAFEEGAMPNVQRLKLGSNAHRAEQYNPILSSIKYLLSLEEITVLIGGSHRTAAKPVLWDAITKHPSTPIINIRYVDWIFYCEEEKIRATQEQEQPSMENQYENVEVDSDRQHGILEMNTGKDTTQEQEQPSLENQYENVEADSDRQHGILEMNTGKDKNNQADCRISMSPESSSHLPSPDGNWWFKRFSKRLAKHQRSIVEACESPKTTIQQKPEVSQSVSSQGSSSGSTFESKRSIKGLYGPMRMDSSGREIPGSTKFSLPEIQKATKNFSPNLKVGQGGSGTVYKGQLGDGTLIAVKRAKKNVYDNHTDREFRNEIEILKCIEHLNLVRFHGYLEFGGEQLIIMEYISNGNLREHLDCLNGKTLEFSLRLDIAIDVAHAITYLHTNSDHPVIHRDIKSSNILLTDNCRAKVADFGFAKLAPIDVSHVSTQVKGTAGYLDPEYLRTYQLNEKSDVYSFGVLLVELVTGRRPIEPKRAIIERVSAKWAMENFVEGNAIQTLDPNLEATDAINLAVEQMYELALQCLAPTKTNRPSMRRCAEILWSIRKGYRELALPTSSISGGP